MRDEKLRIAVAKALRGEGWSLNWDEISAKQRRPWLEMADLALDGADAYKREHSWLRRVRRKP